MPRHTRYELRRKCAKCNITAEEDESLSFHRFPLPGKNTTIKAHVWAEYCYPTGEWSTEKLRELHTQHKMLCSKHFDESAFTSSARIRLNNYAIPIGTQDLLLKYRQKLCTSIEETEEGIMMSMGTPQNMLEVCIDSLESAVNAIHGTADELEVCSSLTEGGLTPSVGLVQQILQMRPKVNVMIRCRTGSDFCYTEQEMDTMLSDIEIIKLMGVDRFVFGALTDKQDIDENNCKKVVEKAYPIPVTFHRAFDVCKDPVNAINKIISLGFNRLLTSGQRPSASDDEAMNLIEALLKYTNVIEIMPGAGVNANNAKSFIDIGCKIIHSSCKMVKYLPRIENNLSMGTNDSESIFISDENIVRETKEAISS